jgi:pimeloyl-ACP methyl ester carboxylesterase
MKSVIFDGHFGWLHGTVPSRSVSRGVVLCKPPGHEAQWLHRTYFVLAQQLAAQGVPTLRFDYLGSGDSDDRASEGAAFDLWLEGISSAVRYMHEIAGIEQVDLCGVRMGATLAALAAQSLEVDRLLLVAPVISGRAYMREVRILQTIWLENAPAAVRAQQRTGEHTDLLGYCFDAQSTRRLQQINLLQPDRRPAARVLLCAEQRDTELLAESYRRTGAQVDILALRGYAALLQPAWRSEVPQQAIAEWVDWLAHEPASNCDARAEAMAQAEVTAQMPLIATDEVGLLTAHAYEQPISFDGGRCFGILSRPLQASGHAALLSGADRGLDTVVAQVRPVVLIANTGGTSHVGEARFGVFLARYLAQRGFSCLRIDVGGIGDSLTHASAPEGALQLDAMQADMGRASEWLKLHGYTEVIALGICSGAYLALQAAARHTGISSVLAVNPENFIYRSGTSLRDIGESQSGSTGTRLHALFKMRKWREVLRGQIRLAPVVRSLVRNAKQRLGGWAARLSHGRLGGDTAAAATREIVLRLEQRQVEVRLLFSPLEPGIELLRAAFGGRLAKLRHLRSSTLPHMDHELLNLSAREEVARCCVQLLEQRLAAAPALTLRAEHLSLKNGWWYRSIKSMQRNGASPSETCDAK